MGLGAFFALLAEVKVLAAKWQATLGVGKGAVVLRGPEASPAFLGVGFIIGPKLAGINFSGGVLAWGCSRRPSPSSCTRATPRRSPTGGPRSCASGGTTCA